MTYRFLGLLSCLFLVSCSDREPPLVGKREAITSLADEKLISSPAPLILTDQEVQNASWCVPFFDARNRLPFLRSPSFVTFDRKLNIVWKVCKYQNSNNYLFMPPLYDQGVLYWYGGTEGAMCFDMNAQKMLWTITIKDKQQYALGGGVALSGDSVWVSFSHGLLVLARRKDGMQVWKRWVGTELRGAPVPMPQTVSVLTAFNQMINYDRLNGQVCWLHRSVPEKVQFLGAAIPAVHDQGVIVAYGSGEVVKVSQKTGSVVWRQSLFPERILDEVAKISHLAASPVIADGVVYLVTPFSKTVAINVYTGEILWSCPIGGYQTPVVSKKFIFLIAGRQLCVIERSGGRFVKAFELSDALSSTNDVPATWMGPLFINKRAYLLSQAGHIVCCDVQKNKTTLLAKIDNTFSASLILAGQYLVALARDGALYALSPSDA